MAVERVERLLRETTAALEHAGVEYAVVGGNAVAIWVGNVDEDAVRATKNVDLLVRRTDIQKIIEAVRPIRLEYAEVLGVHMLVEEIDPSPKRGVHFVLANEKVRAEYTHCAPDPTQSIATRHGYRVVGLTELVIMKLQSYRLVDQLHVLDMHSVGLITPEIASRIPADLQERLAEVLKRKDD